MKAEGDATRHEAEVADDPRVAKDNADLERVPGSLDEARRRHAIITRLLPTVERSEMSMRWLDRVWRSLDDLLEALRAGEDEILKASGCDVSELAITAPSKRSRRGVRTDLYVAPLSAPGAIRLVLAQHEAGPGLLVSELAIEAAKIDSKFVYTSVVTGLHAMRKRGEVERSGARTQYRYKLSTSTP